MKYTLIILVYLISSEYSYSQLKSEAIEINGISDVKFFDSVHRLNRSKLSNPDKTYRIYVGFKVKDGSIINFEMEEIPGLLCPLLIKKYIHDLMWESNGKWKLNDSGDINPKEIIYRIELVKKDFWKQEIEAEPKSVETLFTEDSKTNQEKVPLIKRFNAKGKSLILPIDF